jgi:uncharacterized coiled-coil protein SlyX
MRQQFETLSRLVRRLAEEHEDLKGLRGAVWAQSRLIHKLAEEHESHKGQLIILHAIRCHQLSVDYGRASYHNLDRRYKETRGQRIRSLSEHQKTGYSFKPGPKETRERSRSCGSQPLGTEFVNRERMTPDKNKICAKEFMIEKLTKRVSDRDVVIEKWVKHASDQDAKIEKLNQHLLEQTEILDGIRRKFRPMASKVMELEEEIEKLKSP